MLEASVRVPLVVRWPGRFRGGQRCAAPASLLDLLPAFARVADGNPPHAPEEADLTVAASLDPRTGRSPLTRT